MQVHVCWIRTSCGVRECTAVIRRRATKPRGRWAFDRWAERSKAAHSGNPHALFGICTGGMHQDLRDASLQASSASASMATRSAAFRSASRRRRCFACSTTCAPPPRCEPAYLMGVGTPEDIVAGWSQGSTCSTACCPRATRATAGCSRASATSGSATRPSARHAAAGHQLSLLHVPELHARLSASPAARERDPRRAAATIHNLHYYLELAAGLRRAIAQRGSWLSCGRSATTVPEERRRLSATDRGVVIASRSVPMVKSVVSFHRCRGPEARVLGVS